MQYAKNLHTKSQFVDNVVILIDDCRRQKDYYFADYGKMILNGFGIAVMNGENGSTWSFDHEAAEKQMLTCNENMLRHKHKMIESGEWPSGT